MSLFVKIIGFAVVSIFVVAMAILTLLSYGGNHPNLTAWGWIVFVLLSVSAVAFLYFYTRTA